MTALLWLSIGALGLLIGMALFVLDWFTRPLPPRRPAPRPLTLVARYSRFNPDHPHPLREPTLYVNADSDEAAWAILEGTAA